MLSSLALTKSQSEARESRSRAVNLVTEDAACTLGWEVHKLRTKLNAGVRFRVCVLKKFNHAIHGCANQVAALSTTASQSDRDATWFECKALDLLRPATQ